ncbi:MAG TPA: glycosyltransferase 87 family protein, partial [Ktedonobacterales bacterium]|nr:glycosyltransferase 87 family protein [Ktedonobacterales bacterium]
MGTIDVGKDTGAVIARGSGADRGRRAAARLIPIVIALVATYALLIVVAMVTTSFNGRQLDFSVYYAAEAALRANPHANIYDPSVLASAARALPGCKLWPGAAYPYPPLLAILMLPLGALPFDTALHVWMLFSLALWAVDTALLVYWLRTLLSEGTADAASNGLSWRRRMANVMRGQADGPAMAAVGVVAVSVLAWPLLQGLLMGQVHVLLLFLLLCVPLCVRRNRPGLAGALLALAIMIKVLPLLLLAYYLARGRWRLVLSAAAVSLLLLGATWLVVGAPTLLHAQAIFGSGYHFANSPDNLALAQAPIWLAAAFGSHAALLVDGLGRGLIALIAMLFAGGLVVVWRMARAAGAPRRLQSDTGAETTELLGYGWAICAMLLLSPLVWLHYYSLLLLPFVVCVGYVLRA